MAVPMLADAEQPYVRILIKTNGNLGLANVGRFMQRLDTGARKAAQQQGWRQPSIEIASITEGSLDLRIKIAGLRLAQASLAASLLALAVQLVDYLKVDPAASRASYTLLNEDRATTIIVEAGGQAQIIVPSDVPDPRTLAVANRSTPRPNGPPLFSEAEELIPITGLQSGVIRRYGLENFVELDARPGLLIAIIDDRADRSELFRDMDRYTFEGELHLPRTGKSYYIVRNAMRLR